MTDIVFADGISFFRPREGAPEFVKGSVTVNAEVFAKWLQNNKQYRSEKGFVTLDLKISKNNTPYFSVNTYKPKKEEQVTPEEAPW